MLILLKKKNLSKLQNYYYNNNQLDQNLLKSIIIFLVNYYLFNIFEKHIKLNLYEIFNFIFFFHILL